MPSKKTNKKNDCFLQTDDHNNQLGWCHLISCNAKWCKDKNQASNLGKEGGF
jgi:hypothetical protein